MKNLTTYCNIAPSITPTTISKLQIIKHDIIKKKKKTGQTNHEYNSLNEPIQNKWAKLDNI